ncbi:MAG: AAA family ATPase [Candidatus Diapherotrites archaeon]
MRIIVTGTPGTGKSTIARKIAKEFKCKLLNELQFAQKKDLVKKEKKEKVIEIKKLGKELNKLLAREKNIVVEGHLLCETRLKNIDCIMVLKTNPKELKKRLKRKGYSELKVQENLFCEETGYCLKKALKNYPKSKIIQAKNEKNLKRSLKYIIKEIKRKTK